MHMRKLVMVALAGAIVAGCSASDLKSMKDDSWARMPETLPDGRYIYNPSLPDLSKLPDPSWVGYDPVPNAYGHMFRPVAMILHPVGVAFNWAVIKPLYMLGGLAPEWFGMTT